MNISKEGIALIKQFEGFSAQAYLCPAGKLTIGYGHVIAPGSGLRTPFARLSEAEAEKLLLADLKTVEAALSRLVRVELSQQQFDALCSLIYNIGVGNFEKSTLLKRLNNPPPLRGREGLRPPKLRRSVGGWGVEQEHSALTNSNPPSPQPSPSRGEGVSSEFLRWVYSGKNILPGLQKRRAAEKELFDAC